MGHTVTIKFDDYGYQPSYSMTCTQPKESVCHADWDCSCESFGENGDENGRPWHEPSYYTEDRELHWGTYDPTHCTITEWFENTEDVYGCIHGGVSFDVEPEWQGDWFEWRVIDRRPAELGAAAPTLLAELADEVERLRAPAAVDDAMVGRAAREIELHAPSYRPINWPDDHRELARVALEAALGVES